MHDRSIHPRNIRGMQHVSTAIGAMTRVKTAKTTKTSPKYTKIWWKACVICGWMGKYSTSHTTCACNRWANDSKIQQKKSKIHKNNGEIQENSMKSMCEIQRIARQKTNIIGQLMKKSYVSLLISLVKLELAGKIFSKE